MKPFSIPYKNGKTGHLSIPFYLSLSLTNGKIYLLDKQNQ